MKKDAGTGRSRGFGFVRFFDVSLQQKVFNMQHTIKGRRVDLRYPRRVCAVSGLVSVLLNRRYRVLFSLDNTHTHSNIQIAE